MNPKFSSAILQWFSTHRRPLPWRDTQDPYAIWLSEVILQQTRIQQGQAYWERFIRRWPDVQCLAAATEDEILREWQGLGYYSRARNLHAAVRQVVEMGRFPTTFDELRQLKGVGDYTAAAIASIAFGQPVAVVDGNVYRVLSRFFGIDTPINTTEGKKLFARLAQDLIPASRPSDFNQAMMDFGALQCVPQSPECSNCPLAEACDAFHTRRTGTLPVKLRKRNIRTRYFVYYYVRLFQDGHVLTAFRRRPAGDIWQGLWEPPMYERPIQSPSFPGTVTLIRHEVKHVLTHQVIYANFYLVELSEKPASLDDYKWIPEEELNQYGLPRLVELLVESLPEKTKTTDES